MTKQQLLEAVSDLYDLVYTQQRRQGTSDTLMEAEWMARNVLKKHDALADNQQDRKDDFTGEFESMRRKRSWEKSI